MVDTWKISLKIIVCRQNIKFTDQRQEPQPLIGQSEGKPRRWAANLTSANNEVRLCKKNADPQIK